MLRCSKYCVYSYCTDRIKGKGQQKTLPQTLQNLHDITIILCTTPTPPPAPNEQCLKFWNSLGEGKKKEIMIDHTKEITRLLVSAGKQ